MESPITIGRSVKCRLSFENEKSISRVQCYLHYDLECNIWMLKDGLDKPSMNGTWYIIY